MLGIDLGNNQSICHKINISNKIDRMATRLNIWSQRNLSLIGKVNIAKPMGISNLIYSLNCVQCKESLLKEAQSIVNKFIWSKKPSKIKHWSLAADYDAAGINSPDLITMQKALRLAWLQRIWTIKTTNEILHLDLERYGGLKHLIHSDYNVDYINVPLFYKDIFVYLKELDIQYRYGGVH